MNLFATILLIIILILLIGDLFYLKKILKLLKKKNKTNIDERYFELKYHLNLLKSISAILLFIFGFIGYSGFNDFKKEMSENFNSSLKTQREKITKMDKTLENYKKSIDSIVEFKNQLNNLIELNDTDLKRINNKVSSINKSFKYNPKIYIVNQLSYPEGSGEIKFEFSKMKTIHGETLPKFKKPPFITVQGYRAGIDILEITTTYILLNMGVTYEYPGISKKKYFEFDLWIGSQE
ncbi:hypothetical protein H0I31_02645 [Tenacibaculum sp. AHE15PA]|uniref:hypothetical protein n=1 Tax=unclassified Tenacibaculum TaxID=2635139 RepID=UPI001C4E2FA1|nr:MULTISPECIES: hypothetical protein [unclassified Tenacibaculum]QXP72618.1 hypothetical protein H0I30_07905 [Tenacibaculum sp. AHE14PA]QXP76532.1 hypothetical protein H0I31_02645 [Tenacibaculum sp. AHE15PA]